MARSGSEIERIPRLIKATLPEKSHESAAENNASSLFYSPQSQLVAFRPSHPSLRDRGNKGEMLNASRSFQPGFGTHQEGSKFVPFTARN